MRRKEPARRIRRTEGGHMDQDPTSFPYGSIVLRALPLFFGAISLLGCQAPQGPKDREKKSGSSSFKKEFSAIWENATAYTLEVLDSMPGDKLGIRPADSSMSFRDQVLHIESNIHHLTDRFILGKDSSSHREHDKRASKSELKDRLQRAFQKVESTLAEHSRKALRDSTELFSRMKVPKTRVFLLMRDHMTHHRAQMIIALREAGKAPPDYRGW